MLPIVRLIISQKKSNYCYRREIMICESCRTNGSQWLLKSTSGPEEYHLCANCLIDLVNLSLTSGHFKNLIRAGHSSNDFMIHGDFYDEEGCALQPKRDTKEDKTSDPWKHRSEGMQCRTCMWFVGKKHDLAADLAGTKIGRCRRHAPTMTGYPVCFQEDWCGDHKLDETKVK